MNHTSSLLFFTRNCTSPKPPLLIGCVNVSECQFGCQCKEISFPFQHHPPKLFVGINFFDRLYWHVQKKDLVQISQKLCFLDLMLYSFFKQPQQLIGAWVCALEFFLHWAMYMHIRRFPSPILSLVWLHKGLYVRSGWTSTTWFFRC